MTESALTPKGNRERTTQIMMETFSVPKLFVSLDAVLSLYASGRVTGAVLSSGFGVTSICPIYEGYCLPQAISRLELAGSDVSEYLHTLLLQKENVYPLDLSTVTFTTQNIKKYKKVCLI